jgi:DNA polymerase-3 subunit delta
MVEWRYADFSSMTEKELTAMEQLCDLAAEHPYSTLAFIITDGGAELGSDKHPGKFLKRFGKKMNILRFDKSTDNQLYAWLKKHFDAEGVGVTLEVLKAMVFRCGHSMDVLINEVHKLSALAKARGISAISTEHIEEVSSSTPECDTFAFSNAIIDRNKKAAFAALEEMKIRRVDPITVTSMMIKTYGDLVNVALLLEEGMGYNDISELLKMNQYKLKIYAAAAKKHTANRLVAVQKKLADMDTSSKYGGITGYTAIELFVSKYI